MSNDAIERLRRENPFPDTLPAPAIEPLRGRLGDRGPAVDAGEGARRSVAGLVFAAVGVGVALVVAIAILLLGRGHTTPTVAGGQPHLTSTLPSGPPTSSYPLNSSSGVLTRPNAAQVASVTLSKGTPGRGLLSILGVLRRPATTADQLPSQRYDQGFGPGDTTIYVRYIRRARVAYGSSWYLIPERAVRPSGFRLGCGGRGSAQIGVELLQIGPGGGGAGFGSCGLKRVSIGISEGIASGLVPDGVARVSFYFATTRSQNPRTIISLATHTINTPVINNMYIVDLGKWGRPAAVVYRSANGTVLKRFNTNQ